MSSLDRNEILQQIAGWTERIQSDESDVTARFKRGRAYCRLPDLDRAMADFEAVLRLDPRHAEAHSNQGWILAQLGDWERAAAAFSRSISVKATPDALVKRATAYGRLNMKEKAREDLLRAMGMDASDPNVPFAEGLYNQWHERYEDAIRAYDRSLELSADATVTWYRAECLHALDRWEQAIKSYNEYIRRENPGNAQWIAEARRKIDDLKRRHASKSGWKNLFHHRGSS